MDRVIKLSDLRDAINEAYEQMKSISDGTVDSRLDNVNAKSFAISVALADGTIINKGDTAVTFPMGQISRIPVTSLRLEQKAAKGGECNGKCFAAKPDDVKPDVRGARAIRAISKLQPVGDPDSKWNLIENRMIGMIGTAPQLDYKLYEKLATEAKTDDVVGKLEAANFKLADDATQSVDLYNRGMSMTVNTQQLAEMGATIVADGVNPFTRQIVYDGVLSQQLVARLAMKSHKLRRFIMKTGLPASASFSGGIIGILPGVMAIAAYSPAVGDNGVSIKAARAVAYIMKKLQLNVFGSEKVVIVK